MQINEILSILAFSVLVGAWAGFVTAPLRTLADNLALGSVFGLGSGVLAIGFLRLMGWGA